MGNSTAPRSTQANQNLGDLLYAQERHGRASRHYLKALAALPDRPEICWGLERAYEAVAELGLAEQSYRDAIRVDPSFPPPYFSLGTMLFGLHRWEETIELYQTFLSGPGRVIQKKSRSRKVGSSPAGNGWKG